MERWTRPKNITLKIYKEININYTRVINSNRATLPSVPQQQTGDQFYALTHSVHDYKTPPPPSIPFLTVILSLYLEAIQWNTRFKNKFHVHDTSH